MKKKISLLGLILILVLSFTGCGKSETTEYDQTTMEQYADTIISAFSSMSEEDMDYYENLRDLNLDITLLQAQLPIDGSDFLTMIESWKASQEECGAYIEHGDWTMKVSHDGATLSSEGKFEDRDAETLNEKAAEYKELQSSPNSAAARGYVDAIIEPADTRKYVIGAFEMLFTKREDRPAKKHGTV